MADKRLTFALEGKGWADQKRQLDSFVKSMESLKKAGHDVSKVFKTIDTTGGIAKFNKDLFASAKSMRGLGKETQEYLKAFTDQKVKTSQEQLKTRLGQINDGIKRYVEFLRTTNVETGRRIHLESNLVALLGKKMALEGEVGPTGFMGGLMGRLKGMVPTTPFGQVMAGVGLGAGGVEMIQRISGMYADYTRMRAEAKAERAEFATAPLIQGWRGQLGRAAYEARLGILGGAEAYSNKMLRPELRRQGLWGAAAGAQNPLESVVKGGIRRAGIGAVLGGSALAAGAFIFPPAAPFLAAAAPYVIGGAAAGGAGLGIWKEAGTDPKAIRDLTQKRLFQEGRALGQRQFGAALEVFDYYNDRAESFNQMQRLLGTGIYGRAETGTGGIIGQAMRGGYTRDEAERVALDMTERGGARAAGGGAHFAALRYAREYGIERAGGLMGGVGMAGGFRGAQNLMYDSLANAVSIGLGKTEMKIEREAYVEAVMSATERLASKYGGMANLRPMNQALAASMSTMAGPNASMITMRALPGAFEAANAMMAGGTSPFIQAMRSAPLMQMLAGGQLGTGPLALRAVKNLRDIPKELIKADNPLIQAYARLHFGISEDASLDSDAMRKASTDFAKLTLAATNEGLYGAATAFLKPDEVNRVRRINQKLRRLKGSKAPGAQREANELIMEVGALGGMTGAPGTPLEQGLANERFFSAALGQDALTPEELTAFAKGPGGPLQEMGVGAFKLRGAAARGELTEAEKVDMALGDIKTAIDTGAIAVTEFTKKFGDLKDIGPITDSFSKNLDTFMKALELADTRMGHLSGRGSFSESRQKMNTPNQAGQEGAKTP